MLRDWKIRYECPSAFLPDDTKLLYDRSGCPVQEIDYDDPDGELRTDSRSHNRCAKLALEYYNDKHCTDYEVVTVLGGRWSSTFSTRIYCGFTATPSTDVEGESSIVNFFAVLEQAEQSDDVIVSSCCIVDDLKTTGWESCDVAMCRPLHPRLHDMEVEHSEYWPLCEERENRTTHALGAKPLISAHRLRVRSVYIPGIDTSMAATSSTPTPKWTQKTITVSPQRHGCHLITSKEIGQELSEFKCGLAYLFLQHTSASLTINENYDKLRHSLNRVVPEHISTSSMFGCALTIPITNGKLNMGTWQVEAHCTSSTHLHGKLSSV